MYEYVVNITKINPATKILRKLYKSMTKKNKLGLFTKK
nr:hypothetical protein [Mucilaginibacter sp. FT3.2]